MLAEPYGYRVNVIGGLSRSQRVIGPVHLAAGAEHEPAVPVDRATSPVRVEGIQPTVYHLPRRVGRGDACRSENASSVIGGVASSATASRSGLGPP